MGFESEVVAIKARKRFEGKLHVDSRILEFRSRELKCEFPLDGKTHASFSGQLIKVARGKEKINFEVPGQADRWVDKILNPPDRAKKLGLKEGLVCWLSKGLGRSLAAEVRESGGKVTRDVARCDLAFFWIDDRGKLPELLGLCGDLPAESSIWAVYPKGAKTITQSDVMNAMKKLGFGPSKTAAFDEDISSMRYRRKSGS